MERDYGFIVNDKRVLRLCRAMGIKSCIKSKPCGCTVSARHPEHVAENILNRKFTAQAPDEKWLADVTEFKYYLGIEKHKVYLSAILDLYDCRIVAYVIRDSNNNSLVFDTFDDAVSQNPIVHPLFHSDRGGKFTSRNFHERLENAGMTQSLSRVGKCIDNGSMEGFWGILKREKYYGRRFTDRETLIHMIEDYITYYNHRRYQQKLGVLTPWEKYEAYNQTAA